MRLLIALLLLVTPAYAADYYVCDTAENTGSDSNNGSLGSPWLTVDKALSEINNLSGGDTLSFCEGYDETGTANTVTTSGCTDANRCTIGRYTPSGQDAGDNGVLPIIRNTTNAILQFSGDVDGGFDIENLHLIGAGVNCVSILSSFDHIEFSNVTFEDCTKGVYLDSVPDEIVLTNVTFTNVTTYGYEGASNYGRITGATFTGVGSSVSSHPIYLKGSNVFAFSVEDTKIHDSNHVGGACSSDIIEIDGSFRNLSFNDVVIYEDEGTAASGCNGILFQTGTYRGVSVSESQFEYLFGSFITCTDCTSPVIEHNNFIGDDDITDAVNIQADSAVIDYNHVILKNPDTNRTAFRVDTTTGLLTNNKLVLNDADDACWRINAGMTVGTAGKANYCYEAIANGVQDHANKVVN